MREELVKYIKTLPLGGFTFSEELPREEGGLPLYVKNPKRIYVSEENFAEEPLYQCLDGSDVHSENTTLSVYFTADAKNIPANYSSLVGKLRLGRTLNDTLGYNGRRVEVSTEYDNDLLVTRIDYTFVKLT